MKIVLVAASGVATLLVGCSSDSDGTMRVGGNTSSDTSVNFGGNVGGHESVVNGDIDTTGGDITSVDFGDNSPKRLDDSMNHAMLSDNVTVDPNSEDAKMGLGF